MNEFFKRLTAKLEHRSARYGESPNALENEGIGSTLSDEIETFERIFAEQLARLKARAVDSSGVAPQTSRQENQPLHPAAMEPDRKMSEIAGEAIENDQGPGKNGIVDSRDTDYAKQIGALQLAYEETNAALAKQADAADKQSKDLTEWKAAVESKLESSEQQTRRMTAAMERVLIKVRELASRAEEQEGIFLRQQADLTELREGLNRLAIEMDAKSFTALTEADLPSFDEDLRLDAATTAEAPEEKTPTDPAAGPNFALTKVDQQFLTAEKTQRITFELAEALNVMETLASLLLLRHVKALGESLEKFPVERLPELFDALALEVPDEQRRIDFRQRLDHTASFESLRPLT